jgi:hypothetical protein
MTDSPLSDLQPGDEITIYGDVRAIVESSRLLELKGDEVSVLDNDQDWYQLDYLLPDTQPVQLRGHFVGPASHPFLLIRRPATTT